MTKFAVFPFTPERPQPNAQILCEETLEATTELTIRLVAKHLAKCVHTYNHTPKWRFVSRIVQGQRLKGAIALANYLSQELGHD